MPTTQAGQRHAVVVGAGLAGSLMACYLARAGWRASVYERRPDPRTKGYAGGRSINLALSARGLAGLRGVGVDEKVLAKDSIAMRGRMIHPLPRADAATGAGAAASNTKSLTILQPYSKDPKDAIHSVSRGGLNLTLLSAAAQYAGVSFHFDQTCVDIDPKAPTVFFEPTDPAASQLPLRSTRSKPITADLIIGADGAFSAVRARLQSLDRFDYSQSYLEHGYKELHIPPLAGGGFALDPHALHIWPRGGSMMIALPNRDGSFTCTLFWPFEGSQGFGNLQTPADVLAHFREYYPDAVSLMPTLVEDYFQNPSSSLVTVRCWPWQRDGKVVLIGDAAHAIVPFYGQGMNAAFEDCLILAECLARGAQLEALAHFQSVRKPEADAIADMAMDNFLEMRDKVGDPAFLYKKRAEQAVHALFPNHVTPQYNLVSFSTVPYTEARRRGRELDAVLERIIAQLPPGSAASMTDERWLAEIRRLGGEEVEKQGSQVQG